MKIKKSDLVQLIKEEAERLNKIRSLVGEKAAIEKQLNEMYVGEEGMDEGWLGPNEEEVKQGFLKTIAIWGSKGYIKPNQQEFDAIMAQAKADKFEGKLGTSGKKIIYRPQNTINWQAPQGHNFGSGAPE